MRCMHSRHARLAAASIWLAVLSTLIVAWNGAAAAPPPSGLSQPEPGTCPRVTSGNDLEAWVRGADPNAQRDGNTWEFSAEGREVLLVFDEAAGRMRLMTPAADAKSLSASVVERALQANFDTALDARYAIAHGLVWSVFIHPLPTLTEADFASALRQVVTAAETFGSSYSSGELHFRGGDSEAPADPPSENPSGPPERSNRDEESI